jgi:hypothetical protein
VESAHWQAPFSFADSAVAVFPSPLFCTQKGTDMTCDEWIRRQLATLPPLTTEQRAKLLFLLSSNRSERKAS